MPLVEFSGIRRLFPTAFLLLSNKYTVKSQYLDRLQKLLKAQIKCFSTAITDRKKVLKNEVEDLRQRIAAQNAQLTKATKFQ